MKKVVSAVIFLVFVVSVNGQVFNTATTLKKGKLAFGLNPAYYNENMGLFLHGNLGIVSGVDLAVKYGFLDARHNDFIFAIIAQQWGFWGCLALLGLYVVIIGCGLEIAVHNTDPFGRLLAVGIVAMFLVEVIVNVSMTIGLMPITGLTLPFVSYGGSSLLVSMAAVGLLNNVGRCRPYTLARKT